MAKYQLKTSLQWRFGQTTIIPYAGEVTFDKETGEITAEVANEDELNQLLIDLPDLSLIGTFHTLTAQDLADNPELKDHAKEGEEVILPQVHENELGKSEDEKNDIGAGENEDDILQLFTKASFDELKHLAADFPEDEWKALDEVKLKEYLIAKLTPATA